MMELFDNLRQWSPKWIAAQRAVRAGTASLVAYRDDLVTFTDWQLASGATLHLSAWMKVARPCCTPHT